MGDIDIQKLYQLQDNVLEKIYSLDHDFYLTGGTCLNRFYHNKRVSYDLDLFNHNNHLYSTQLREIQASLEQSFTLNISVKTKDFTRLVVNQLLQIDLVNERLPRMDSIIITDSGIKIDSIENILSNKLTAVLGRDEPKDIFDIFLISKYYSFSWKDILKSAREKLIFNLEDLALRMKSFPQNLLRLIKLTDNNFLEDFSEKYPVIIDEIIHITEHHHWKQ